MSDTSKLARNTDPEPSQQAAQEMDDPGSKVFYRRQILTWMTENREKLPLTCQEMCRAAGWSDGPGRLIDTWRRRIQEAEEAGLISKAGERRCSVTGKLATTYGLNETGPAHGLDPWFKEMADRSKRTFVPVPRVKDPKPPPQAQQPVGPMMPMPVLSPPSATSVLKWMRENLHRLPETAPGITMLSGLQGVPQIVSGMEQEGLVRQEGVKQCPATCQSLPAWTLTVKGAKHALL